MQTLSCKQLRGTGVRTIPGWRRRGSMSKHTGGTSTHKYHHRTASRGILVGGEQTGRMHVLSLGNGISTHVAAGAGNAYRKCNIKYFLNVNKYLAAVRRNTIKVWLIEPRGTAEWGTQFMGMQMEMESENLYVSGLAFATTEYICHESASIKNESNGVKNYLPEELGQWVTCQYMNNVGPI